MNSPHFSSYQSRVLLVLSLINFVNWIDRQIVLPLFPLIQAEFHVSYAQLGWLVAAFSIVHSFGTLGLGRLADLTSRKKLIGYGILYLERRQLPKRAGFVFSLAPHRAGDGGGR